MTYRYPETRKPHVRKSTLFGQPCWQAGRPGYIYLMGEGWHFDRWEDAMAHATSNAKPYGLEDNR